MNQPCQVNEKKDEGRSQWEPKLCLCHGHGTAQNQPRELTV